MKNLALIAVGIFVVVGSSAKADAPAKSDKLMTAAVKPHKPIKLAELTCEDFLSYDEVLRPQIVYLSDGLNKKGKPEDVVIDIDRINSLVPVLVEECQKEPHTSYWQKVKNMWNLL